MHVNTISRRKNEVPGKTARKDTSNYILKIGLKLLTLTVVVGVAQLVVTYCINRRFFRMKKSVPLYASLVPVVGFLTYLIGGKGGVKSRVVHCRYNPFCSFLFRYDKQPVKNERIDLGEIKRSLLPGDILLRKQRNHLDEIIFAQNSYFTHVGICTPVAGSNVLQVLHATSEKGVASTSVEEFCSCEEVAVLRFSPEGSKYQEELTGKHKVKYDQEAKKIRRYIRKDNLDTPAEEILKSREIEIFDSLNTGINSESKTTAFWQQNYLNVVIETAKLLEGVKYDLSYDFKNFSKLSCIEYVWYSYKCLFPLHRIKVEDFEYFRCITWPVIIPDVFIKNEFFTYVYSSIPNIHNSEQLREFVQSKPSPLWRIAFNILLWDALILWLSSSLLGRRVKS